MNLPSKSFLLTTILLTSTAFASEADDVDNKSAKKCLKVGALTVCNNATVGRDLVVGRNEVISGSLTVNGVDSDGHSADFAGDIIYDLNGFPNVGLSPIGSLATALATTAWASVAADGTVSNNSDITVEHTVGTGIYTLTFTPGIFVNTPIVLVSSATNQSFVFVAIASSATATIDTVDTDGTTFADHAFNVIAIGF